MRNGLPVFPLTCLGGVMKNLRLTRFFPFILLFALFGSLALAAGDDDRWTPTPPRLSFIDGEVSYWRPGAEDWVRARRNLALAEGDALYTDRGANFEVQFDSRSFVRADENSQLSLLNLEEHVTQFKVTRGRVSFDMRSLTVGDSVEISTPDAVFIIEQPGYYRVEVNNRDTHFITRRGGQATITTADGRSLSIYPSEEVVVTGGNPVQVATYAAPQADSWDRWNDARTDRIGESVSSRYLPRDVYGVEELDHYGAWRVVPEYGSVWIPRGMAPGWVPYSTGSWAWDPYYEWTWIDDAPWGWAPFHYGRWVFIGNYWAWTPGPIVRRPVYSPALVAFMIRDGDVSVRLSVGLPGLWWVALSWGEPMLPWWGHHKHRGHPRWDGWGGSRVVNNVIINQTTIINVGDIHFHNARHPRAVLGLPAERFGREPVRAAAETRTRQEEFTPLRDGLPKPSRASLLGGAPKGVQPPREVLNRSVVSARPPRENKLPWQDEPAQIRTEAAPQFRYVKPLPRQEQAPPSLRREENRPSLPRPPFGTESGSERIPSPQPPRLRERIVPTAPPPPSSRAQGQGSVRVPEAVAREANRRDLETMRQEAPPITRPPRASDSPPAPMARPAPAPRPESAQIPRIPERTAPPRAVLEPERNAQPLPGKPASQIYRGRDQQKQQNQNNPQAWEGHRER